MNIQEKETSIYYRLILRILGHQGPFIHGDIAHEFTHQPPNARNAPGTPVCSCPCLSPLPWRQIQATRMSKRNPDALEKHNNNTIFQDDILLSKPWENFVHIGGWFECCNTSYTSKYLLRRYLHTPNIPPKIPFSLIRNFWQVSLTSPEQMEHFEGKIWRWFHPWQFFSRFIKLDPRSAARRCIVPDPWGSRCQEWDVSWMKGDEFTVVSK